MSEKNKKSSHPLILAVILGVVGMVLLAIMCAVGVIPAHGVKNGIRIGLLTGIKHYFLCFVPDPGLLGLGTIWWADAQSIGGSLAAFVTIVELILAIMAIVVLVKKAKKNKILSVVFWFLGSIVINCVGSIVLNGLVHQVLWRCSAFWYGIALLIGVFSWAILTIDVIAAVFGVKIGCIGEAKEEVEEVEEAPAFDEETCRRLADEEIQKHVETTSHELDEKKVEGIVTKAIEKHVEELHTEYVDEEAAEEEPAEEPAAEPAPAEEAPVAEETPDEEEKEGNRFDAFSAIKRVPFEEKLASADEDLRKKYQELRNYILSYGVKSRVSIPGDTFSAHRERYVFLTIAGKHIKAYFALDPVSYENTKLPIEKVDSKKFEDLPACMKVKSDLSFRRALKLIDDVMAAKGVAKSE